MLKFPRFKKRKLNTSLQVLVLFKVFLTKQFLLVKAKSNEIINRTKSYLNLFITKSQIQVLGFFIFKTFNTQNELYVQFCYETLVNNVLKQSTKKLLRKLNIYFIFYFKNICIPLKFSYKLLNFQYTLLTRLL